jgi:putative membrane protein
MMTGGMMGSWGMGYGIFGFFMMLLFWVLIIAGVAFAIQWFLHGGTVKSSPGHEAPLEILKKRYAKGEIDRKEFVARKQELL